MKEHKSLSRLKLKRPVMAVMLFVWISSVPVFGDITYELDSSVLNADPAIRDQIVWSVGQAVSLYNEWGSFNKELYIVYNPAVPTANASYSGYIQFGGSRGTKTALHEISHTLGVGTTHPAWANNLVNSTWMGPYATGKVRQFDGPSGAIYGDNMHFWPYGLNYGEENRKAHIQIVANLREDVGVYGIVEEAQPQSVASGGTAVFSITAPQATSYAWYKQASAIPLTDGGDISGSTTDTLTISNVLPTDEGAYYCEVANLSLSTRPEQLSVDHEELYERKDCTLISVRGADAFEVGNKFVTGATPPTIRALGFIDLHNTVPTIDPDGDGLLQSHRVTLWRDSDGAKITEVTVPAGTGGHLINGFRYVAIPEGAITLDANTAYVISADGTGIQDPWLDSEPWLTLSDYYIGANGTGSWQGRWGTPGSRPAVHNSTGSFYGLVNITSKEILAPLCAAPANFSASAGDVFVSLNWDDNTESDLYGYNVYRSDESGGPYTLIGTDVTGSDFSDSSLTATGTYYYVVIAMDINATESALSNEGSATVLGFPVWVDDVSASVAYTGWWGEWSDSSAYNSTLHYSADAAGGAAATFSFTGSKAAYYGTTRNDLGIADIYLDGQHVTSVDCYSSATAYMQALYETPLLPFGNHTLSVQVTGDHNPAATATDGEIIIDAFAYMIHPGNIDTDEDGMTDADEAIAGTNPDDPASWFAVTSGLGSGFVVEWLSVSNRQYQVYRADSLTNSFNPIGPVLVYPQNSYTDSVPRSSSFYKVEVQLQ